MLAFYFCYYAFDFNLNFFEKNVKNILSGTPLQQELKVNLFLFCEMQRKREALKNASLDFRGFIRFRILLKDSISGC